MILTGYKKRILRDAIRYYVDVTKKNYEDFINDVQLATVPEENGDSVWLAKELYAILKKQEITLSDCIENKDTIHSAIKAEESRNAGEFYTPEIWAVEGREYLKRALPEYWGTANIWEASCGTGNLIKGLDYPQEKIFMSTLLPEDIAIVKGVLPEVTAFPLDFVNGMDWDANNMHFSEKLPSELRKVLENDEPIIFYMNPPYKVMAANRSDVGAYMSANGMSKCALDIFHQFMYRLILLKRTYNLTKVYLGIFGPVTMFHSPMIEPLYEELKSEFQFVDGFCFDAGDFANTSESVGWIVGYTVWKPKEVGHIDKQLVLSAKRIGADNSLETVGTRLISNIDINIHDWVKASDILREDIRLPMVTNYFSFKGNFVPAPENRLGYVMSSNYVIRATRRASVTTLPNPDNVPVTIENLDRAIASFAARRCYVTKQNSFDNSQYYSKPDTEAEGYEAWLNDALALFLFDYSSHQSSYRDVEIDGAKYTYMNRLFPLTQEYLRPYVSDPYILVDMDNNPGENQYMAQKFAETYPKMSPEAQEFSMFCVTLIVKSLQGTARSDKDHALWTQAWDAGLAQIRGVEGLLSKEDVDMYLYKLSNLKSKLLEGAYNFNFLMKTAYETEDLDNEEQLSNGGFEDDYQ